MTVITINPVPPRAPRRRALTHRMWPLLALAILVVPACSEKPPTPPGPPGGLAIVAGVRANMPHPDLVKQAQNWLDEAVLRNDALSVFEVSGKPELLYSEQINQDCDSDNACSGEQDQYADIVRQALDNAEPKAAEADTLGAILLAANAVKGAEGVKRIVVIDSGLQTAGVMPMQAPGAFFVDSDSLAASISQNGTFRPLEHVEVLLTGLGSGAAPQDPVSPTQLPRLETLWTTLLTRLGATVTVDSTPMTGAATQSVTLPVSVVGVEPQPPAPIGADCFRIREDQVGFKPNEATFVDLDRAKDVLGPIAREINSSQVTVTAVGTTALPEPDAKNPLSNNRAQAVVGLLASLDVPKSRMLPGGVGTNFAGYKPPYVEGVFSEPLAVQDRLVIIQPVGQQCQS